MSKKEVEVQSPDKTEFEKVIHDEKVKNISQRLFDNAKTMR